jgi:hypothetical protein
MATGTAPDALDLGLCRPSAVGLAEERSILATLPVEGEVTTLSASHGDKLQSVRSALRVHARDTVYDIKVIDIGPVTTALVRTRGALGNRS